jgi:hypothetical protein
MLEPKVIVKLRGEVLLDTEEPLLCFLGRDLRARFRSLGEIAFASIFLEGHGHLRSTIW